MQVSTCAIRISKEKLAPTLMALGSGLRSPSTRMLLGVPGGTPTQRLASTLLGQPVEEWVAVRRDAGLSWRAIALGLKAATNQQVAPSSETIRGWFKAEGVARW